MSDRLQTHLLEEGLLQTKLYRPRIAGRLVERTALIARLNEGLDCLFTLVSAPPGYGKTTLVNQWLESIERPAAWLSLDESDSDLGTVLAYLLAALRTAVPDVGRATEILLGAAMMPTPERLADSLLNELQSLPQPIILVIDDYHVIRDSSTHLFIARFLEKTPETVHIVLITRSDPPFSLTRLWGQGLLQEVRARQLRFNRQETAELLQSVLPHSDIIEIAGILDERTEGWPAALHLVTVSLRDSQHPLKFVRRFAKGDNRLLMDYVLNEVLAGLSEDEQRLLLQISILDRFSAPLLAALANPPLEEAASRQLLTKLWRANLFLIALDDSGTWYRYHHLFRDLMRLRLRALCSAEEISHLSARASTWYENVGLIEEALKHALNAGDKLRAAHLVEARMHEALNDENWRRLERWLTILPEDIRQRPGILAAQMAIDQIRYRVDSVKVAVDKAQAVLLQDGLDYTPAQVQQWQGVLDSYKTLLFSAVVTPQMTMQLTAKALDSLPADALYVRSLTEFWQIYALQMSGQPQAAANLATDLLRNQIDISPVRGNRLLLGLCSVYWGEADITNLRNSALVYRRFAERTGQLLSIGWSAFLLGWSQYQNNELEAAEQSFAVVKQNLEVVHVRAAVDSLIGMALIQKIRHRDEEARQTLADLREFLIVRENVYLLPLVETLAWRLGIGDQSSLHTTGPFTPEMIQAQLATDLWELPVLTRARANIESLAQDRLAAAEHVLHESRAFAQSRNSRRILLRIGALQTLLHLARGEMEKGMACLHETVLLGESGGALREILDLAPTLYPQLEHLREQGVAPDYLERMLAAYTPGTTFALTPSFEAGSAAESGVDETLATVLTYREVEVLLLVEQRLSNQQIAQKLYLSPHTVKKHTVNIYRKLGVKNRREAVVRARTAGLLPKH